jgi:predicted nucleic acid-binding protein
MGGKHRVAVELLARLAGQHLGVVSIQVLAEYYNAATKK